jgi:hypothetical protein
VPLIDDAIIANLDNVISKFQNSNLRQSEADLLQSLEELKNVKEMLQRFNNQALSSAESSFMSGGGDAVRSSLEMLENGGKFVNPIGPKDSIDSMANPLCTSSRKSSQVAQNWSGTSLKNSMTVAPCKFNRPSTRKMGQIVPPAQKQPKKRVKKEQKEQRQPKITKTFYATCRIHRYDDSSHTFEVLRPRSVTRDSDEEDKAPTELVIVLLANGETALFASKHGSLLDSRRHQAHRVNR